VALELDPELTHEKESNKQMNNAAKLAIFSEMVAKRSGRMAELIAKEETDGLSRRESAEKDKLWKELQEIREKMDLPSGQALQPGSRSRKTDRDVLKPEDSFEDWAKRSGSIEEWHTYGSASQFQLLDDERENLSLGRMVRGAVTGSWENAGPERRALAEGVLADGGYALGPDLASRMIDRIRNAAQTMALGATTVPLSALETYQPRLVSGANVSFKEEGDPIDESSPQFDRIVFTAHTLPCLVRISGELFSDLSGDSMNVIEGEIAKALALELDRASLRGSGIGPNPTGILYQDGVSVSALGSGNGATPGWDDLIDQVAGLRAANVEPNGFIYASRTDQTLGKLKDGFERYLGPPPTIQDVTRAVSNQVPVDLTVGSSHDCSEIYCGKWSDLLVGIRNSFQFRILSERFADTYEYGFLATIRADVQLAHPAAFSVLTGVKP
jgi:HK97 family phage major capsid protein